MEYRTSDSSGTDDDLPPTYPNRSVRGGRISGNGRTVVGASSFPVGNQNDMEVQIHQIEQEAYRSVLRAFKAQSDTLTWEKEGLITELRKELGISDKEHRDLLGRVTADDMIHRIREWRQSTGLQAGVVNNAIPVSDMAPSPTAPRKRQKTAHSGPTLSVPPQVQSTMFPQLNAPMQPSSSATKKGVPPTQKSKKTKPGKKNPGSIIPKPLPYSSTGPSGRDHIPNRNSSRALASLGPGEKPGDPLIGRKVWTRWPDDNSFYEAVITEYNPVEGRHLLMYDINTPNATCEWVDLKEIPPEDIRWGPEDPGINQHGIDDPYHAPKKSGGRAGPTPIAGRGRGGAPKASKKTLAPSQNGIGNKSAGEIEILHTETLIKEVERVFGASHPDPLDIERAREVLKEHERSLIDAIARLGEASDGESDEQTHQPPEYNRGWRNPQHLGEQRHGGYYEGHMGVGRDFGDDGAASD